MCQRASEYLVGGQGTPSRTERKREIRIAIRIGVGQLAEEERRAWMQ
jgi:hypothetical protein